MEPLNSPLLNQSTRYHGTELQKMYKAKFEEICSSGDIDLRVFTSRRKRLHFKEPNKRFKILNFIAENEQLLFSEEMTKKKCVAEIDTESDNNNYVIMPPLEVYLNVDKVARMKHFLKNLKIGDLILASVQSKTQSGIILKILCNSSASNIFRYVADTNIKGFCSFANIIPAVDNTGVTRRYMIKDTVCCEVLEVIHDTYKIVCGMKGTARQPSDPEPNPRLGLIHSDDLPVAYKKAQEHTNESYEAVLERSIPFNNPSNIPNLTKTLRINSYNTLMRSLCKGFPEDEYASELRQVQASKWAEHNVAIGIEKFNAGNRTEAFQYLNKALIIDPKHIDAFVTKGALYVNNGDFRKGLLAFETALKLNANHAKVRKYMGETLVALGKFYEEENKVEEAYIAYQCCLNLIPNHKAAQDFLESLKNQILQSTDSLLPNLLAIDDLHDSLASLFKTKKVKEKEQENHDRSSSSSSSNLSSTSCSSSSLSLSCTVESSSSSSSDSEFETHNKHKQRSHRREKEKSLSPFSKRMDSNQGNQFNKPSTSGCFEEQVRAFFEKPHNDSDYEGKVQKFLEETAKLQKAKQEEKMERKAKKERKRMKKLRENGDNMNGFEHSGDEESYYVKLNEDDEFLDEFPEIDDLQMNIERFCPTIPEPNNDSYNPTSPASYLQAECEKWKMQMINFSIIVSRAERYAEEESDFSDEDEDGSSTSRSTSPTGEKSNTEMMTKNESEVSEKQQSNESQSPTPTKSYRKIYAGRRKKSTQRRSTTKSSKRRYRSRSRDKSRRGSRRSQGRFQRGRGGCRVSRERSVENRPRSRSRRRSRSYSGSRELEELVRQAQEEERIKKASGATAVEEPEVPTPEWEDDNYYFRENSVVSIQADYGEELDDGEDEARSEEANYLCSSIPLETNFDD